MEIGPDSRLERSTRKIIKTYVCGRGPKTIKSRRGQWVEEDMTMDPPDTTNGCTEEEDSQELVHGMNTLRKLLFVDVLNVMERNNSNDRLYKDIT
jgi:hypothetical protein